MNIPSSAIRRMTEALLIPLRIPDHDPEKNPAVLLTLDEARAALRMGRQQFDDMRKTGMIETVSFGRSVRVVADSVRSLPARLKALATEAA